MQNSIRLVSRGFLPFAFLGATAVAPFALYGSVPPLLPFAVAALGPLALLLETGVRCALSPAFRASLVQAGKDSEPFEDVVPASNAGASIALTDIVLDIKAPIL